MLELSWLLPLATLSHEMSALKKRKIRGNKKGQVPGISKEKKKVRREVKMDKCPTVELGTKYPPERKEKENVEHLILLTKFQRARKVCIPSKSKSRIRLPPLLSPYTIHSPHLHILI